MASGDFQNKVAKMFECNVCIDKLNDAKMLHCTHLFCKTCLDKMLQFRCDGSAFIKCPLGCEGRTLIDKNNTTNDLKVPVQLKNLVEMLLEKEKGCDAEEPRRCEEDPSCKNDLAFYCNACFVSMCSKCKTQHNDRHDNIRYIPIKADANDSNNIHPWCEEHSTFATYACLGSLSLLCTYCKERSHAGHHYDQLDTLTQQVKTWVSEQDTSNLETLVENIKSITSTEVDVNRERLLLILSDRKLKLLSKYIEELNKEEERLLSNFDLITSQHCEVYPSLQKPSDFVSNVPQFQLFINRDRIVEEVKDLASGKLTIQQMNICLSLADDSHPLGNIVKEPYRELKFCSEHVESIVTLNLPAGEVDVDVTASLIKDLEKLLQQALARKDTALKNTNKVPVSEVAITEEVKETQTRKQEVTQHYQVQASERKVCNKLDCLNEGANRCSRCKAVKYCSKDCQKEDWKSHRHLCIEVSNIDEVQKCRNAHTCSNKSPCTKVNEVKSEDNKSNLSIAEPVTERLSPTGLHCVFSFMAYRTDHFCKVLGIFFTFQQAMESARKHAIAFKSTSWARKDDEYVVKHGSMGSCVDNRCSTGHAPGSRTYCFAVSDEQVFDVCGRESVSLVVFKDAWGKIKLDKLFATCTEAERHLESKRPRIDVKFREFQCDYFEDTAGYFLIRDMPIGLEMYPT